MQIRDWIREQQSQSNLPSLHKTMDSDSATETLVRKKRKKKRFRVINLDTSSLSNSVAGTNRSETGAVPSTSIIKIAEGD